ncbi:GNAT family N-acetyltransferase [Candidatus Woesearchaeota archaeon]|jgi:GNAT superfamily N-acetyltransferase|nr:GNAT family N-acetyltransferase [Candidatus Woesearchaeota archaeon]MBT6519909.1 GNAT family N-acetyltransferase [Candidatus Woesearchaeota archaeon]MBT7367115.1 GNAT family N-acetyltransferase [Candidatus Woesearchaeota archaeon]
MAIELISNAFKNESDPEFVLDLAFELFKGPNGRESKAEYLPIILPWLNNPGTGVVMAYENNVPVGFGLYRTIPDLERLLYEDSTAFYSDFKYEENAKAIEMLAVKKDYRKKGIGVELVNRILEDIKKTDSKQTYATCWKGVNGESYHLLKKFNFKDLVLVPRFYADGTSGIIVGKNLS